ncbi:MAG TPA: endo-1,4-beta-xylanase, partial [Solirubrobacteraceae bacterium]|nr:endo-1,4-beta-xylanase [Solirubrobacteraceae bacterium]
MQGCLRLLAFSLLVALCVATPAAARTGPVELGAAINDWGFSSGPSVYRSTFLANFGAATHEHSMKMIAVQSERGRFDFGLADRITDWALENGKRVHGHTLLWCRDEWNPDWVTGRSWTRAELLEVMETHIRTVLARYRGRISTWDVVNEGVGRTGGREDCVWQRYIGDDWIEQAFRIAHEADPDALLFFNEYAAETVNAKFLAMETMVKDFLARGVPIHGVGLQHHTYGAAVQQDRLEEPIARLGALGLQVHVSELDVPVVSFAGTTEERLAQQAQAYQTVVAACEAQPACFRVTTWGFVDGIGWRPAAEMALPFDTNYQPKPAWPAIRRVVAPPAPPPGNRAPGAPGAPTTGTAATRTPFTVAWGAAGDADGHPVTYTLQHRDADDAQWSTLATGIRGTAYAFNSGRQERQGTWSYRVRADDGYVEGPWVESAATTKVDRSAPFAPTVAATRAAESAPWFRDTVTVAFTPNGDQALPDGSPGVGVDAASVPANQTFGGGTHSATGTVKDQLGNTSVARTRSFSVDATPPTATLSCPAEVEQGSAATGTWTASDGESGVGAGSGSIALPTETAGTTTAGVDVADRVGHVVRAECTYVVVERAQPEPPPPTDTEPPGGEDPPPTDTEPPGG